MSTSGSVHQSDLSLVSTTHRKNYASHIKASQNRDVRTQTRWLQNFRIAESCR